MSEEIIRLKGLLDSLTSEDSKNPYILYFERIIEELTGTLEGVEREILSLSSRLENEQKIYDEAKATIPGFKDSLKPLSKLEYVNLVREIKSEYNFEEISADLEASIVKFMEEKRVLIENYKDQKDKLENQREELIAQIKANQNNLTAQKELRDGTEKVDGLISLIDKSKDPESTVTKAAVYAILRRCFDENGKAIFNEDELDIVANMVMFSSVYANTVENKASMGSIFQMAREGDYPEEEHMPVVEPIRIPTATVSEVFEGVNPAVETRESNRAAIADRFGPWENPEEDYTDIDALLNGIDTEEDNDKKPEMERFEVQEPVEDIVPETTFSESPYDLIADLEEEPEIVSEPKQEQPVDNRTDNIKTLRSLGLPGDPNKYPVTLTEVTKEDIEKALELAKTYGITIRNIGDVVKILSTNNVKEAFEQAIRTYGEDYPSTIRSMTSSKIIAAYKPHLGKTTYAVKQYISTPELIDALGTVKDVYDSSSYMAAVGLMGQLEKNLENSNYALFINDRAIPKTMVLRNLEKLMALNPKNSDEELMLIALTYDPQLSALDVQSIKDELEEKLVDSERMGYAA